MSGVTSNPQRPENNEPPQLSAFKANYFVDPFLSHPTGSEEQLVPLDTRHLLSGPSQENHHLQQHLHDTQSFTSPASGFDGHPHTGYHPSGQSTPGFFSPESNTENGHSDFSTFPSPGIESQLFGDDQAHLAAHFADLKQLYIDPEALYPATYLGSKQDENVHGNLDGYSGTTQLLSPVLTNTPSPSTVPYQHMADASASNFNHNAVSPASMMSEKRQQLPTLQLPTHATTPCSNTAEPSHPEPPPSPVVKISSYSRGDSPSRENDMLSPKPRRRSISSAHLAPADHESDGSDDEDDDDVHSQRDIRDSPSSPTRRAADGSWIRNTSTGLGGLDPSTRTAEYVPNLKEMTAQREIQEKNAVVERWLSVSEANSEVEDNNLFGFQTQKKWRLTRRRRSRSTGSAIPREKITANRQLFDDSTIPGPGALIDEESGVDDDEDDDDTPSCDSSLPRSPGGIDANPARDSEDGYFPRVDSLSISNDEPLPRQFIRARPWKDPPRNTSFGDMKEQPFTSNAAIFKFLRRADNIETASRRATWGTREVTEVDVESILGNNSRFDLMRITDDGVKEKFFRRTSIFEHASKLLPKRSHSGAKRKHSISMQPPQPSDESVETGKSSPGSSILPQRKPSFTRRSKLPTHTGGALLEMGRQIASVGVGTPVEVQPSKPSGPWSSLMRRSRSRSDVPKGLRSPTSGKLPQLMTAPGGPAPTLVSPTHDQTFGASAYAGRLPVNDDNTDENDNDNDEDDEEMTDENGVVMDFPIRADLIVPTLEGFKTHVQQLNPRLQPALVERIGQEQLRRYKKLVEHKLKHAQSVSRNACMSGKHCFAQGGEATILPPKTSPKEHEVTYGQFQVTTMVTSNDDGGGEGAVTAAMFPPGVPLPPVKRLPAEFECSLCFKVKKFQKPSDWTKHVHEDIQPFTCTFPECPEPKSFKRKADWVRHENERHRHLEWWACSMPDCNHICHRRDNFVQHLVREHKLPDQPKGKGGKGRVAKGGKMVSVDDAAYSQDAEKVAELVDSCRHVTDKQPKDEACRFCGNVCNSWKKLTVHLAKHMEQVALPVLKLVEQRTVSANMVVSPVDESGMSSAQSNMTTPVDMYPNAPPLGAQGKLSSQSQRGRGKNRNGPQPIVYGTAALLTEAFSVQKSSVSSKKLQMHNALSAAPPATQQQQYSMSPSPYSVQQPYSQRSSPNLQGQSQPSRLQRQFGPGNVATYPPPYNAPPRQPLAMDAMGTPNGMPPYNLDVSSSTAPGMAGFAGGQLYSSPTEQFPYMEGFVGGQTGLEHGPPAGSVPYTSPVSGAGMGYQMGPSGPGQGHVFAHPAAGHQQY